MKTSLAPPNPRTINRSKALNCLLINQFATPGLGSLLGRRFLAGTIQLLLAVLGFLLVVAWFVQVTYTSYRQISEQQTPSVPDSWLGKVGFILFLSSWLL